MPDKTLFHRQRSRRWGRPTGCFVYDRKCGKVVPYHPPRPAATMAIWATTRYHAILRRDVTSVRDTERQARKLGLEPIGDARLATVARQYWPTHPLMASIPEEER